MDELANSLMEELECRTAFEIPIFGGIPVPESCVITWVIMAVRKKPKNRSDRCSAFNRNAYNLAQ